MLNKIIKSPWFTIFGGLTVCFVILYSLFSVSNKSLYFHDLFTVIECNMLDLKRYKEYKHIVDHKLSCMKTYAENNKSKNLKFINYIVESISKEKLQDYLTANTILFKSLNLLNELNLNDFEKEFINQVFISRIIINKINVNIWDRELILSILEEIDSINNKCLITLKLNILNKLLYSINTSFPEESKLIIERINNIHNKNKKKYIRSNSFVNLIKEKNSLIN